MANIDTEKLKTEVHTKFENIREALGVREKLLLRQIDLICSSQLQKNITSPQSPTAKQENSLIETKFLTENEDDLLKLIRGYGKFNLDNINLAFQDLFINEDYISPAIDHETMYKCLASSIDKEMVCSTDDENANEEKIVVDFSKNRKFIRESIVNITLNETKELIESNTQATISPLELTESSYEENLHSTKSSQTEVDESEIPKKKRSLKFKPKITINNCNGIINLKNISNLTINCAKEDSIKSDQPLVPRGEIMESSSTDEILVSSTTKDEDTEDNSVNCEFYNRLLNEIKNSLMNKNPKKSRTPPNPDIPNSFKTESDISELESTAEQCTSICDSTVENTNKKFVLKNFENLKIILEETDGNSELHPIQIEQWLAEIISETEIEPMQNVEILEHSGIHNN